MSDLILTPIHAIMAQEAMCALNVVSTKHMTFAFKHETDYQVVVYNEDEMYRYQIVIKEIGPVQYAAHGPLGLPSRPVEVYNTEEEFCKAYNLS